MSKYAIWDKKTPIFTPVGEVLTAEKWIERYPIAGQDSITVVCGGGEINGEFFGTLGQMVAIYTKQGCDFSNCVTNEDKLRVIEEFDEEMERASANAAQEAMEKEVSIAERTATALEAMADGQTTENSAALEALLNGED